MESKKLLEIVTVLLLSLVSLCSCTSTQKTKDLIGITGIDILQNQMNIKWIRTHFNFKEVRNLSSFHCQLGNFRLDSMILCLDYFYLVREMSVFEKGLAKGRSFGKIFTRSNVLH